MKPCAWAAFAADEEAARYLGGVQPRAVAWRGMCAMAGAWAIRGYSMFSVIEKSTGRWVGRLGPWRPEGWPGAEIGWGLARAAWGRGYATEAAAALVDWALSHPEVNRVCASMPPDNAAAIRVARKIGMRLLGTVWEEDLDEVLLYGIDRERSGEEGQRG